MNSLEEVMKAVVTVKHTNTAKIDEISSYVNKCLCDATVLKIWGAMHGNKNNRLLSVFHSKVGVRVLTAAHNTPTLDKYEKTEAVLKVGDLFVFDGKEPQTIIDNDESKHDLGKHDWIAFHSNEGTAHCLVVGDMMMVLGGVGEDYITVLHKDRVGKCAKVYFENKGFLVKV